MGIACTSEIEKERKRIEIEREKILKEREEGEKKIKNLETALKKATEGRSYIIKELEDLNLGIDFSNYENKITDLITEPKDVIDATKFYDVIVSIQSIKDIIKGWNIKLSKEFEKNYKSNISEKILKIGVIGNSNKGKSFILSNLSKIPLPSGTSIKTEGLSIKYPDCKKFKNRKIALLDSAGLETPVIKENNKNDEIDDKKKEINENIANKGKNKDTLKDNEIKNEIKNEINNEIDDEINNEINNEKNNIKNNNLDNQERTRNDLFKEKSREKILTELFLQNYIIHNSDILIVVVGLLTYSEQKLLNRIKTELKRSKLNKILYIIHNLITYTTKNQVENYINETLLKSATFELERQIKINMETENENNKGVLYYEKNSNPQIFHLIFANEGSEAGQYYNEYTLNFLKNTFEKITDLTEFDILETVKERFKVVSKDIIENLQDEIEFNNSKKLIKLVKPKKIALKECYIDELGFSNLKENGFQPNYNYYRNNNNQIIIKVEAPGTCNIKSSFKYSGEYIIIKLTGIKEKDEEPARIEDNIFNGREIGKFSLDIPLKYEDFIIKHEKPKIEKKDGIFTLTYQLEKNDTALEYPAVKN